MPFITTCLPSGAVLQPCGLFDTGTVCIYINPADPGGGMALVKLFKGEVDFDLALNTLIEVTDEAVVAALGLEPLEFGALIEETIAISLGDLLALFLGGGGGGGFEISQTISDTLDPTIPIFGGAAIEATLTLATLDALPSTANTQFCDAILAGP